MKTLGRISAAIGAGVAGIGAAVFLHPRSGASNRRAAAGVARRQSANVATMVGATVSSTPGRGGRRQDQLVSAVRTELGSRHPGAADGLQVSAHKSTVTLRGEVATLADIELLEGTARSVSGVGDVNNLLRLAATPSAGR